MTHTILDDEADFEALYGEWNPSLYAAAMAPNGRHFALLVGGPRFDDPYTIILARDVGAQTFSRSDVRRELRDIRVLHPEREETVPSYVTISRDGDIYLIRPTGSEHSVIPGSRAESEDGADIEFNSILPYGDRWLVSGSDGFMKLGKDMQWQDAAPPLETNIPYRKPQWSILGTNRDGEIYVIATQMPDNRNFVLREGHPLYREDMPAEERFALKKTLRAGRDAYPQLKTLFTGRPGSWKRQELPQRIASSPPAYPYISALHPDGTGTDYILGSDGLVMKGSPSAGFSDISSPSDRKTHFNGGVLWRNQLILTADSAMFRFDQDGAQEFLPDFTIKPGAPGVQPAAILSRQDTLHVFDHELRHFIFDGAGWIEVDIPEDLSRRPFKPGSN